MKCFFRVFGNLGYSWLQDIQRQNLQNQWGVHRHDCGHAVPGAAERVRGDFYWGPGRVHGDISAKEAENRRSCQYLLNVHTNQHFSFADCTGGDTPRQRLQMEGVGFFMERHSADDKHGTHVRKMALSDAMLHGKKTGLT